VPADVRAFVVIGICGGFATFSSFSLQTLDLARDGSVEIEKSLEGRRIVRRLSPILPIQAAEYRRSAALVKPLNVSRCGGTADERLQTHERALRLPRGYPELPLLR
jgi:hypothetical protein